MKWHLSRKCNDKEDFKTYFFAYYYLNKMENIAQDKVERSPISDTYKNVDFV